MNYKAKHTIKHIGFTKIYKEGELLENYYVANHLKFLIISNDGYQHGIVSMVYKSLLIKDLEILLATEQ